MKNSNKVTLKDLRKQWNEEENNFLNKIRTNTVSYEDEKRMMELTILLNYKDDFDKYEIE